MDPDRASLVLDQDAGMARQGRLGSASIACAQRRMRLRPAREQLGRRSAARPHAARRRRSGTAPRNPSSVAIERPDTMASAPPRRSRSVARVSVRPGSTTTASGRSAISTSVPSKSRNRAQSPLAGMTPQAFARRPRFRRGPSRARHHARGPRGRSRPAGARSARAASRPGRSAAPRRSAAPECRRRCRSAASRRGWAGSPASCRWCGRSRRPPNRTQGCSGSSRVAWKTSSRDCATSHHREAVAVEVAAQRRQDVRRSRCRRRSAAGSAPRRAAARR